MLYAGHVCVSKCNSYVDVIVVLVMKKWHPVTSEFGSKLLCSKICYWSPK